MKKPTTEEEGVSLFRDLWVLMIYKEGDRVFECRWVDIYSSLDECRKDGKLLAFKSKGSWRFSCIQRISQQEMRSEDD